MIQNKLSDDMTPLFERAVRDEEFHSSFHVIHKVGNYGIFVLLRFVSLKKLDGGVNHFNF